MGDVVKWPGLTRHPIPVEDVCEAAKDLEYILVIGYDKDGELAVRSNTSDSYEAVVAAQRFVHKYFNGDYDVE